MRALAAAIALGAVAGVATAARACADPVPADARSRAEDAFVVGRLQDLDGILGAGTTAADLEPLFVRDGLWRPLPSLPPVPEDDGSLSSRRIRWIVGEHSAGRVRLDGYPLARAGEADLYPRLTALVLDRARRESVGAAGLPAAGPLATIEDETIQWLEKNYAGPVFAGAPRPDESEEDRRASRESSATASAAAARNRSFALASVGGILLAVLGVGAGLARRRKPGAPPTDF